jgi:hypothetical protein
VDKTVPKSQVTLIFIFSKAVIANTDIVQENNVMMEDDSTEISLSGDEEKKDEMYQALEESEQNDQMTYSSKLTRNGSSIVE